MRHAGVSLVLPEAAYSEACSLDGRNETDTGMPCKIIDLQSDGEETTSKLERSISRLLKKGLAFLALRSITVHQSTHPEEAPCADPSAAKR